MAGSPLDALRSRMARAVTERIGSADAPPPHRSGGPVADPWLPADSPVRLVHGDVAMLIGGVRALLLQSLHPVAMQAVAEHSGYAGDPWGRFRRTAAFIGATTFGTAEHARDQIERVRSIHRLVSGTTPDGLPYRASDPHLLTWVHDAEVDSFLTAYRHFGRARLSAEGTDRYVADMARTGAALGVIDPPRSWADLQAELAAYRPELHGGGPAKEAARLLLWDPPLSGVARAGYAVLAAGAISVLPAWSRAELGLPTLPIVDRAVLRPAAAALLATLDRGFQAKGLQRPGSPDGR